MRLKRLDFQEIKQSVLEKFQYVNMKIGHFIRQTAQRLSRCVAMIRSFASQIEDDILAVNISMQSYNLRYHISMQ